MNTTRLMVVSSVHVGKGDMEELLLGKTKLGFLSVKFDNDDTRKRHLGVTSLMLLSSTKIDDEDSGNSYGQNLVDVVFLRKVR
jgi:hypothetical protein